VANDGKFLNLSGGQVAQEAAIATSAGAGDAGKIIKLDGAGKLDSTLMPAGVAPESRVMTTSEAVVAGDVVNIHNSTGPKVRKADATNDTKPAQGFVLAGAGAAASVTVYPEEAVISGLTGLTPGDRYYLTTTAGLISNTPPSGAGNVVQEVGYALSTTELMFRPQPAIKLA
jgi:hypothetical protein